jgi:hypothetical protein
MDRRSFLRTSAVVTSGLARLRGQPVAIDGV